MTSPEAVVERTTAFAADVVCDARKWDPGQLPGKRWSECGASPVGLVNGHPRCEGHIADYSKDETLARKRSETREAAEFVREHGIDAVVVVPRGRPQADGQARVVRLSLAELRRLVEAAEAGKA